MGIHDLHVAKLKGYIFALTLLEIFVAFDAVDHVFLLESFLPWISSMTLLSPDRLLLSVSSHLSSSPSFPLLACQMLAFPEFNPPSFSFLILYALPGNVLEQSC